MENKLKATEEQLAYAKLLDLGMKIGLIALLITFFIYLAGVLTPHVAVQDVSKYWKLRVSDYLYVISQMDEGNTEEAVALVKTCKEAAAEGQSPDECKQIYEEGHKFAGWSWLKMIGKGDFLNFLGIAFLSGVTIVCYLRIVPILFRKKDTVYGILALIEVLVLVLAASGLLKAGGH